MTESYITEKIIKEVKEVRGEFHIYGKLSDSLMILLTTRLEGIRSLAYEILGDGSSFDKVETAIEDVYEEYEQEEIVDDFRF